MVCGHRAAIRAQQPGDPWRRVVSLPAGWDFGNTFTLEDGDTTSIFFDLSVCGEDDDIYVVADDGVPARVPALPSPQDGWRRVPTANIPPAAHP
jgi:hypothetical protein